MNNSPAAKCNGVDFRPAVSLAFTVCELINFFTLTMSPVLHASNNSRNGSLAMTASKLTVNSVRLRLDISVFRFSLPENTHTRTHTHTQPHTIYGKQNKKHLRPLGSVYFCAVFGLRLMMEETTTTLGGISVADALSHT